MGVFGVSKPPSKIYYCIINFNILQKAIDDLRPKVWSGAKIS